MKMLSDLISTDYGLMSLGVIVFTVGMSVFFGIFFRNKMREAEEQNAK